MLMHDHEGHHQKPPRQFSAQEWCRRPTEKKLGSVSMFNGACLFACLPVHLSVCMYVCLSVCLFVLNFLFFGESLPTFVETALERCLSLSNEATT